MDRRLTSLLVLTLAACSSGRNNSHPVGDLGPADVGNVDSSATRCVPERDEDCRLAVVLDEQPCRFAGHAPGDVPSLSPGPGPTLAAGDLVVATWSGSDWIGATGSGRIIDFDTAEILVDRPGLDVLGLATDAAGNLVFSHRTASNLIVELRRTDGAVDELFRVSMTDMDRAGGGLALEDDGTLWIGIGDGGNKWNGIDETTLTGSLLRVDISTRPYVVPPDNPNFGHPTKQPEIWAIGFRDPRACSISTGELLCSERGVEYVEINRIKRSGDYGWPYRDGVVCVEGTCTQRQDGPLARRPAETECELLPGPHLSAAIPDGDGVRVYGGACSGGLWGVRVTDAGLRETRRIGAGLTMPVGFARVGDVLRTLSADGSSQDWGFVDDGARFPTNLRDSGCLDDDGEFAPSLIPYDVASPLWTDGAHKQRVIALPAGTKADVDTDGTLSFPEGTVILKLFSAELADGSMQPLETRVMRLVNGTWDFYTYVWSSGSAELLDGDLDVAVDNPVGRDSYVHYVPSRSGCRSCHLEDLPVLGPVAPQLDRDVTVPGGLASQLDLLSELGVLEGTSSAASLSDYADEAASLDDRARSYLHANCAHCHRPNGWAPRSLGIDLRFPTPLDETGICDVEAGFGRTWADGDERLDPGDPANSNLLQRMNAENAGRMPPLGTAVLDAAGSSVVEAWIASLTGCE